MPRPLRESRLMLLQLFCCFSFSLCTGASCSPSLGCPETSGRPCTRRPLRVALPPTPATSTACCCCCSCRYLELGPEPVAGPPQLTELQWLRNAPASGVSVGASAPPAAAGAAAAAAAAAAAELAGASSAAASRAGLAAGDSVKPPGMTACGSCSMSPMRPAEAATWAATCAGPATALPASVNGAGAPAGNTPCVHGCCCICCCCCCASSAATLSSSRPCCTWCVGTSGCAGSCSCCAWCIPAVLGADGTTAAELVLGCCAGSPCCCCCTCAGRGCFGCCCCCCCCAAGACGSCRTNLPFSNTACSSIMVPSGPFTYTTVVAGTEAAAS